ncbi:hypothetical protein BCR35DRAFT_87345 [Leucosporidium creatinivorum]|uniref:Uncharacterized protein n=1 Tax=Leucosporidium creatinivorum TaxID=106004 RepID=A0A1Y2FBG6_9BASI|nr:hypothetical protein BCR35DRAFT_87345 [Leucosporidium creatinivorum]
MESTTTPTTAPLYSILRIKRKLTSTTTPLDALLIDSDSPSANKRRRQTGPAQPSQQPSTSTTTTSTSTTKRGIFHFAATVPLSSFDSVTSTRQLKDRISAFLSHPPTTPSRIPSSTSLHSTSAPPSPSTTRKTPSSSTASLRRPPTSGAESPQLRKQQQRVQGFHQEGKRARYRIIERQRSTAQGLNQLGAGQGGNKVDLSEGARGGARPPMVVSSAELAASRLAAATADQTRIYDAVQEEEDDEPRRHAHLLPSSSRGSQEDQDAEMTSQFATMLEEYLTMQDSHSPSLSAASPAPAAPSPPPPPPPPAADEQEEDDDDEAQYVYDVYYRDLRDPLALAAAGGAAATGGWAGGMDVSGLEGLKRVGEL